MSIFAVYADEQRELSSRLPKQDVSGRAEAQRTCLAYQAIDTLRRQDLMAIMDAGTYNRAVMGYLLLALDDSGASDDVRDSLLSSMHKCLDFYGAQEADDYYTNGGQ